MFIRKVAAIALPVIAAFGLSACSTSGDSAGAAAPSAQSFKLSSVSISPLTTANLCRRLGGQGKAPTVTVKHTAAAGVPIRLHMQDKLSDGSTFNHRGTRVASDASGTTVVNYAFLPPCNTTGGRLNSHYQLTVKAGGETRTISWGRYNSGSKSIQ